MTSAGSGRRGEWTCHTTPFPASIVFSGALERFPGFTCVLGEAGVSWIPYILDRMDEEYEDRYYQLNLSMKPGEF